MTENSTLTKRQLAIDAVVGGATHKEAAALLGLAKQTISNWMSEDGISTWPRASEEEIARAVELVRAGHTRKHAAQVVGYNPSTVGKWVKRRGLESP